MTPINHALWFSLHNPQDQKSFPPPGLGKSFPSHRSPASASSASTRQEWALSVEEAEHFDAQHSHDKFESHGTKNAGALPDKAGGGGGGGVLFFFVSKAKDCFSFLGFGFWGSRPRIDPSASTSRFMAVDQTYPEHRQGPWG